MLYRPIQKDETADFANSIFFEYSCDGWAESPDHRFVCQGVPTRGKVVANPKQKKCKCLRVDALEKKLGGQGRVGGNAAALEALARRVGLFEDVFEFIWERDNDKTLQDVFLKQFTAIRGMGSCECNRK